MDVARPHRAVAPSLDGDVLVVLAGTNRPLTGRMVARRVPNGSPDGVRKALSRLVASGLVHREESDGSYLHRLNRRHLAAPAVAELAALRTTLVDRLRSTIGEWEVPPVHASMFGSAARGTGGPESDIDIFLIRPRTVDPDSSGWSRQLDGLHRDVEAWTGNAAGIVELDERDLRGRKSGPPPVLRDIRRDGIDLAGAPLRTVLPIDDDVTA